MSKPLVLGILASLIALVIGWGSREFYDKVLGPVADAVTYKGPAIEGDWETIIIYPDKKFNKLQIRLSRTGYSIAGKVLCIQGYSEGHSFEFIGEFVPPLLTGTYKDLSGASTERGAFAFILSKNGSVFRGRILYSDDEVDAIMTAKCEFSRATGKFAW